MTFIKRINSFLPILALLLTLNVVASMASPFVESASADVTTITTDIYNVDSDNILAAKVEKVAKIVGGVGGIAFVLAILIISLCIIYGSIAAHRIGTFWKALISCVAGAFIFFSAYAFAPAIAKLSW